MWIQTLASLSNPGSPGNTGYPRNPDNPPTFNPDHPPGGRQASALEINRVLENSLPWMASLLFHLGVIILALAAYFIILPKAQDEEPPIVPSARFKTKPINNITATKPADINKTDSSRAVTPSDNVTPNDTTIETHTNPTKIPLIGVSDQTPGQKLIPGGKSAPGDPGIFGPAHRIGDGGGNARKIVYIVDASGSLIDGFAHVRHHLKQSIQSLSHEQSFSVIFFQDGKALTAPPDGRLRPATAENKLAASRWMDPEAGHVLPHGNSSPLAALRVALGMKPDLLIILSDNITGAGKYEVDQAMLLKELDTLNKDRKTKISTIQFLHPDPLNTLKAIAETHGGRFSLVKRSDLGTEEPGDPPAGR